MFHRVLAAGVFFLAALFTCTALPTSTAQVNPKAKDKTNDAEVRQLKAEIAELQRKNAMLQAELRKERNDGDDAMIRRLKQQLEAETKALVLLKAQTEADAKAIAQLKNQHLADEKLVKEARLQLEAIQGAGTLHVLLFTAKKNAAAAEADSLVNAAIGSLAKGRGVRGAWAGLLEGPSAGDVKQAIVVVLLDSRTTLKSFLDSSVYKTFLSDRTKGWESPEIRSFHKVVN